MADAQANRSNGCSWCRTMMGNCAKHCHWFPVMGLVFMGALVLTGYYLSAESLRALWITFAGMGLLMIVFGSLVMGAMARRFRSKDGSGFACPCFRFVGASEGSEDRNNKKRNCCC